MFAIKRNNESLILQPDFVIDYEFNHPLLDFDSMAGEYSIPVEIPVCPHNEQILANASSIEIRDGIRIHTGFEIWRNGAPLYSCDVVLLDSEKTLETGHYVLSCVLTGFAIETLDKNLDEIEFPANVELGANADEVIAHAKTAHTDGYPSYNYAFPMFINLNLYNDANTDFLGYLNNYNTTAGEYYKNDVTGNKYALVPFLYLRFILDCIFKNYRITGSAFSFTDLKNAIVYNNYTLDAREKQFYVRASQTSVWSFPGSGIVASQVNNIDDDTTAPNEDLDYVFDASTSKYTVQTQGLKKVNGSCNVRFTELVDGNTRIRYAIVCGSFLIGSGQINNPDFNRVYELTLAGYADLPVGSIGSEIEIRIWAQKTVSGSWVNSTCDVFNLWAEFIDIAANEQNIFATELEYKNHVPKIGVQEFLQGLAKMGLTFNFFPFKREVQIDYINKSWELKPTEIRTARDFQRITYNENKGFTFNFNWPDSETQPDDLPSMVGKINIGSVLTVDELPTVSGPNLVCLVENLNEWYISAESTPGTYVWSFYGPNYYDKVIGNGENEIILPFSPCRMYNETIGSDVYLLPGFNQIGTSPIFETGVNDPSFKLLFWRGFKENSNGDEYPFSSSSNLDYAGNRIGESTLRFDDDLDGFFRQWCAKWYNAMWLNNTVKKYIDFDVNFYQSFKYIQPIKIGNQKFIVLRMNAAHREMFIDAAECDLLIMN